MKRSPTPADSASTLATIERCVTEGGATVKTAIEAAYQLGVIDGGLRVMQIGQRAAEKVMEDA